MYCKYFDFTEKPFTVTPNPRFVFLSKNHQEAFAHLIYGINGHAGFIELTGEIGTGKTTVLRSLLGQLDDKIYTTALIFNPCLSAIELLRSINREYGIAGDGLTDAELLQELNRFLVMEKRAGRTVVLVIDEAQNLEPSVLERIRLLSNLETDTDKLIQIVLAGQPELAQLLEKRELRQLSQRITVRYHLRSMDFADTRAYIRHRLTMAASGLAPNFMPAALRLIFRFSKGTPRLINILCDRALLIAYTEDCHHITVGMVRSAIREITREPTRRSRIVNWSLGVVVAAVIASSLVWVVQNGAGFRQRSIPGDKGAVTAESPDISAIKAGLAELPEKESFLSAFNPLAALWKTSAVNVYAGGEFGAVSEIARTVGLRTMKVRDARMLLQMDLPAVLRIGMPFSGGVRFIAVTAMKGTRFSIEPAVTGRTAISADALQTLCSGGGYVFWKDTGKFPVLPAVNARSPQIVTLQQILKKRRLYNTNPTGVYDRATIEGVKAFQRKYALDPDGKIGDNTLLYLYREAGDVPRLARARVGGEA